MSSARLEIAESWLRGRATAGTCTCGMAERECEGGHWHAVQQELP
jgi:hypothetical protein